MKNVKRILVMALAVVLVCSMSSCSMLIDTVYDLFDEDTEVMGNGIVSVDDKMMGFFLNDYIIDWRNNYQTYVNYGLFSVDFTKDLRDQIFGDTSKGMAYETMFLDGAFKGSWYEYFIKLVVSEVEMYITYASAAKAQGIALTPDQELEIEIIITELKLALDEKGARFSDWYGRGVGEDDIRRCYELIFLASNFAEYYMEKLEDEIKEEEIIAFRENNKDQFYSADCLTYTIKVNRNQMTDEEYDSACVSARAAAETIAKAKFSDDFIYAIIEYGYLLDGYDYGSMPDYDLDLELAYENNSSTFSYGEEGQLGEFLFGSSPAEKGDTTVIEVIDNDKERETFSVTAYFVTDPMHYDTELTHSFAYLVTDSKQLAHEFRSEFVEADDEKSLDLFVNIAERIEGINDHDHKYDEIFAYSKIEKAASGWFGYNGNDYKVIDDWIESDSRRDGELSPVIEFDVQSNNASFGKTSKQYAVLLFAGHGEEGWYVSAKNGAVSLMFEDWYYDYLNNHYITVSDEINDIEVHGKLSILDQIFGGQNEGNISGNVVTVMPDGSTGNMSGSITIKPIPDSGIVLDPSQGESSSEKTEEESDSDTESKADVNVAIKIPVTNIFVSDTVLGQFVVGGISSNIGINYVYENDDIVKRPSIPQY